MKLKIIQAVGFTTPQRIESANHSLPNFDLDTSFQNTKAVTDAVMEGNFHGVNIIVSKADICDLWHILTSTLFVTQPTIVHDLPQPQACRSGHPGPACEK